MLQRPHLRRHLTTPRIKVAFASGNAEQNRELIDRLAARAPELPLFVVAEFEPHIGQWIPWHVLRSFESNREAVRTALDSHEITIALMALCRGVPLEPMRRTALLLARGQLTVIDEKLREFPASALLRESIRRAGVTIAEQLAPEGRTRKWLRRLIHPREAEIPLRARFAQARGIAASKRTGTAEDSPLPGTTPLAPGVTVVIPSRDGRELLATLLSNLVPQIAEGEIIVSDNGSGDGTATWLALTYPQIRVIAAAEPLSFARAVNAGISAARFDRVMLLNNDMIVEQGFVEALIAGFSREPDVFCTTAQIFFPEGIRREETGKAVWRRDREQDLPLRCDEPFSGEDGTWVLYGSGGCSLYDTAKLRALGGVSLLYDPAYVEDLDLGYRAWKRGWPTLYCAGARVEHRHRATTSRFYTKAQLDTLLERNYLVFLIHAIGEPGLFRGLWTEGIRRLQLLAMNGNQAALEALRKIPRVTPRPARPLNGLNEPEILSLGSGDVAVFPGTAPATRGDTVVICSPFLPFPLAHGGAVRIFNLMKQGAAEWNQVLVAFADDLTTPPPELLALCREVVVVRRHHSHYRHETPLPDTVQEFGSLTFRAVLKQTMHRWRAPVVQLEFTQMAQYAPHAAPARTVLIEHDITFDLAAQLAQTDPSPERRQQLEKWRAYEAEAWRQVDCVVTMSEKDRQTASAFLTSSARSPVCLPNGVDTERFTPATEEPEANRLLFIGSFAHLPNLLALDFFLREVWPLLGGHYDLHVIAGARHEYYLDFFRREAAPNLLQSGIEIEGFIADVRPAYRSAALVIAPLVASAGTNIKVLEAMAMGRVVIATPAGINGLDLSRENGVCVGKTGEELANLIREFSSQSELRRKAEAAARTTALSYDWRAIAQRQTELYRNLINAER